MKQIVVDESQRGQPRMKVVYWLVTTRAMLGWTQRELAEFLGVGCQTIVRWEKARSSMPAETFISLMQLRKRVEKHKRRRCEPILPSDLVRSWKREINPLLKA
jgi:DNA-binding XRE family transcriptional regulator